MTPLRKSLSYDFKQPSDLRSTVRSVRTSLLAVGFVFVLSIRLALHGLDAGTLILFDSRSSAAPLPERCAVSEVERDGRRVGVVRL